VRVAKATVYGTLECAIWCKLDEECTSAGRDQEEAEAVEEVVHGVVVVHARVSVVISSRGHQCVAQPVTKVKLLSLLLRSDCAQIALRADALSM